MSSTADVCMLRLFYIFTLFTFSLSEYVPVLHIASDNSLLSQSPLSAVEKISKENFINEYLKKLLKNGPVVFFQQDTLSSEDFSFYGDIYGDSKRKESFENLKRLSDEYPSTFLPSVEAIKSLPDNLPKDVKMFEVNEKTMLRLNSIEMAPSTLIFFKLPDTLLASDRAAALEKNDRIIGEGFKMLEALNKTFSVIFTAQRPSWMADAIDHVRVSRHILEYPYPNPNITYMIYNDNYTLLFVKNIAYFQDKANDSQTVFVNLDKIENASSTLDQNNSIVLSLDFNPNNEFLTRIQLIFTFSQTPSSWALNSLKMNGVIKEKPFQDEELQVGDIWTPTNYSYTCQDTGKIYNLNATVNNASRGLVFDSIQIQPFFNVTNASMIKFGEQFDCVGFFTIPIWMSIFVTLILIVILAFGVSLLMDINTMDRFDDPKGKTIQVATVE